jgi:hypothetical protein
MIRVVWNPEYWSDEFRRAVSSALLVAPVDVESFVFDETSVLELDDDAVEALWRWAEDVPGWQSEWGGPGSTAWLRDDVDDGDFDE